MGWEEKYGESPAASTPMSAAVPRRRSVHRVSIVGEIFPTSVFRFARPPLPAPARLLPAIFSIKSKMARKSPAFLHRQAPSRPGLKSMFNAHTASYVSHERRECMHFTRGSHTRVFCPCAERFRECEYTGCTEKKRAQRKVWN